MILLLTACNKESATVVNYGINHVSDVEVESIEKGNELYYKVTITQKLDRRAPELSLEPEIPDRHRRFKCVPRT
jgi:hypothetical protein